MKKFGINNEKNKLIFIKHQVKRKALLSLIFNQELDVTERTLLQYKLYRLDRKGFFKTKCKGVCIITGRTRAVNYLGLSRMKIREYQAMGLIHGLKKYS